MVTWSLSSHPYNLVLLELMVEWFDLEVGCVIGSWPLRSETISRIWKVFELGFTSLLLLISKWSMYEWLLLK